MKYTLSFLSSETEHEELTKKQLFKKCEQQTALLQSVTQMSFTVF